jgi:hydroxymethylglutaryl-CoA lyase
MSDRVDLIECPRDAMQGWERFIPTATKTRYINTLLQAGFHTIDFGSFVSPKAIPQMADTREVLAGIDRGGSATRLLAIAANVRGAREAAAFSLVDDIGYPFSVSPTFQQLNANSTVGESFDRLREISAICLDHGKEAIVYLSMAFGNPYGDPYDEEMVLEWGGRCIDLGIRTLSLADTVGLANPEQVGRLTDAIVSQLPDARIGVHLHSTLKNRAEKLDAAFTAGARRFDGAILGLGGCPMSGNALVGNLDMVWMEHAFRERGMVTGVDEACLEECADLAHSVFVQPGTEPLD